jgi:hypothetical protein
MDVKRNALMVINSWKDKQTVIFCEEARKVIKLMAYFSILYTHHIEIEKSSDYGLLHNMYCNESRASVT